MSRYVDADYIINGIKNDRTLIRDCKLGKEKEHYLSFLERCIENTPSIDIEADYVPRDYYEKVVSEMAKRNVEAADIVRCKECDMSEVYQNDSSGVMARYCRAFAPNRMVADDDFCSYGERSDNE